MAEVRRRPRQRRAGAGRRLVLPEKQWQVLTQ